MLRNVTNDEPMTATTEFTTLAEVKAAHLAGKTVHWGNVKSAGTDASAPRS